MYFDPQTEAGLYEFCKFLVTGVCPIGGPTDGYSHLYMKEDLGVNESFPQVLARHSADLIDTYADPVNRRPFLKEMRKLVHDFHDSHMKVYGGNFETYQLGFDAEYVYNPENPPDKRWELVVTDSIYCPNPSAQAVQDIDDAASEGRIQGDYDHLCPGAKIVDIERTDYDGGEDRPLDGTGGFIEDELVPVSNNYYNVLNDRKAWYNIALGQLLRMDEGSPLFEKEVNGTPTPIYYEIKYNYDGYYNSANPSKSHCTSGEYISDYDITCDATLAQDRAFTVTPTNTLKASKYNRDYLGLRALLDNPSLPNALFQSLEEFDGDQNGLMNRVGYVRISTFNLTDGNNKQNLIDTYTDMYSYYQRQYLANSYLNLLIDLRGNGGGAGSAPNPMSYFILHDPDIEIGPDRRTQGGYSRRHSFDTWNEYDEKTFSDVDEVNRSWWNVGDEDLPYVSPVDPYQFQGKVAILVDEHCVSSCEGFINQMKNQRDPDTGAPIHTGIRIFGNHTFGGSGSPETRDFRYFNWDTNYLSAWNIGVPSWIQYWTIVTPENPEHLHWWYLNPANYGWDWNPVDIYRYIPVEGFGIAPDWPVYLEIKDLLRDTPFKYDYDYPFDTVIQTALEWMQELILPVFPGFATIIEIYEPEADIAWIPPETRQWKQVFWPYQANVPSEIDEFEIKFSDGIETRNFTLTYLGPGNYGRQRFALEGEIRPTAGATPGEKLLYVRMGNYQLSSTDVIGLINPECGCNQEWIANDQNGIFYKHSISGMNPAPWGFGTPVAGPGACYGGSGECWATNLSGNYNNNANECIETNEIDLSICGYSTTAEIKFMHWYNFENGYDGANLEAWDGNQWNIIDPVGGYPDESVRAYGTSVHGMRGYSSEGTESTWHEQTFYIQGFSNSDFKVRFCFGSDDLFNQAGWYIDDVTLKLYDGNCGGGCYETLFSTDFNSDDGDFIIDPDQQLGYSWAWGAPTGGPATGADGNVWATNPTGNYNVPEDSCVRSPIVDMSSCLPWQSVQLKFDHWFRFWHNLLGDTWDGAQVQAWDGSSWNSIEPVGGYPDLIYAPGTSLHGEPGYTDLGNYETWHDQTFDLYGYSNSDFHLRFCMAGDYDPHPGWYIDNVSIEGPPAPNPYCQPGMVLYSSDFESDNGGFSDGLWNASNNNTWAYGTATNGPGSCHGGSNCWATNLTANYANCEDSYISKSLDLSACGNGLETVYLVYWHWFEFEVDNSGCDPFYYDGYTITWSGDGQSWSQPETSSFISGGFNTNSIEAANSGCPATPWADGKRGYEDSSGGWVRVVVPIPAEVMTSDFELRFAAGADGSANEAGAYIDDLCIAVGNHSICD